VVERRKFGVGKGKNGKNEKSVVGWGVYDYKFDKSGGD
jgi:hypothetical protein